MQFLSLEEESVVLPLFCVIALDFLICLLTRVVVDETEPDEEEEEEEEDGKNAPKTKSPVTPVPPPPPGSSSNKSPPPPPKVGGVDEPNQPYVISSKEVAFYSTHGEGLVNILLNTTEKLLVYCRLYAMIGNQTGGRPSFNELSQTALDGIMKLAGRDPLQPKDTKPLFHAHIPDEVRERLKTWNSALLIDPAHKEKLCNHDLDSSVSDIIVQFLNLHLSAFTGPRFFGPTRCFKSTLSSLLSLLSTLFEMCPPQTFTVPEESTSLPARGSSLLSGLVPLSCDVMMEFCGADMLKLVKICGDKQFSLAVLEHRFRQSSRLLQLPRMTGCNLLGPLLADFFGLLGSLLDDASSKPVLSTLGPDHTDCREYIHPPLSVTSTVYQSCYVLHKCFPLLLVFHSPQVYRRMRRLRNNSIVVFARIGFSVQNVRVLMNMLMSL